MVELEARRVEAGVVSQRCQGAALASAGPAGRPRRAAAGRARAGPGPSWRGGWPSAATIRQVVSQVCPGGLADLTGADPSGSDSIAVDGKAARCSRRGELPTAHLLAAMTSDALTVTQLRVPDKTNEITCFAALLEPFNLTGVTITADALHTQRTHAHILVEAKNSHYLLVVKANQPALHRRLRSLPWKDVTARRYDRERGHGRRGRPARPGPSPSPISAWTSPTSPRPSASCATAPTSKPAPSAARRSTR